MTSIAVDNLDSRICFGCLVDAAATENEGSDESDTSEVCSGIVSTLQIASSSGMLAKHICFVYFIDSTPVSEAHVCSVSKTLFVHSVVIMTKSPTLFGM